MSPYVSQVEGAHADGVVVLLLQQPTVQFINALRQANPKVKIAMETTEPTP